MGDTATAAVEGMLDIDRYPLTAPDSPTWADAVGRARSELAERGCTVLPGFVRAASLDAVRTECASVAGSAYYDVEVVNAYNTADDPSLPADHPVRTTMERGNAFVARDDIPADFLVHRLYTSAHFQHFVASCFGLPEVHELADPLAGLCLNVLTPGRSHPWHFDTNEFAVSMLTQESERGGLFEYCPGIRSAEDEHFDDVAGVLAGRQELVRRLALRPGDLQLFRGRHSLHRVTAVEGDRDRHTVIFAYSAQPGVVGTVARTRQLFGRVLPEHEAAEQRRVRVDAVLV